MDLIKLREGRMVQVSVRQATDAANDYLKNKRIEDKNFVFDRAFAGFAAKQELVYRGCSKGLVDSVIEGENATIFAYGSTGSGKTYTMIGTEKDPGVIVQALDELFVRVSDIKHCKVEVSFLEVYCERVKDLLAD